MITFNYNNNNFINVIMTYEYIRCRMIFKQLFTSVHEILCEI